MPQPSAPAGAAPAVRTLLTYSMNNFRVLTLISAFFFVAIGISSPLITLYLESLGADYARISLILTSFVVTTLAGNYLWGRVSDRLGRRKPVLIAGLLGMVLAYLLLSRANTANDAWLARILEGASLAAFTTLSLAIMGDTLENLGNKGRRMGIYRGIGSLAFSAGALTGGRLADAYSLPLTLSVCAGFFLAAAGAALFLHEVKAVRLAPVRTGAGATAPPTPNRGLPLFFVAGVLLWMAAHSASTSMWPNYMASLGYSKTAIGSLWGFAAFIEMPAMYLAGVLSDTFGRALLLAAGGFAIATVQLGYIAVAQFLPALAGVQIIRGFGFGSYTATAMTYTAEQSDVASRGGKSGLFYTAASAGQLVGMFLGGTVAQALGFTALYSLCLALALGSGVCFLALRRRDRRIAAQAVPSPSR